MDSSSTSRERVLPAHYSKHRVDPIDLIESYNLSFEDGNVIKYVARAGEKNGLEDKFKALYYLLYSIGVPRKSIPKVMDSVDTLAKKEDLG